MERTNISEEQYAALLDAIFPILAEKGPCATTMDLVASRLSMSKRTLYEIFESKDSMLLAILQRIHDQYSRKIQEIMQRSDNMMEAMASIFLFHQSMMRKINVRFFRDMDTRFAHLRKHYDTDSRRWIEYMSRACALGVSQGVFREDVNYDITIRLLRVQMESLKRMEEFFPEDITLVEAYSAISLGMLRSIASEKGMRIVDSLAGRFDSGCDPCQSDAENLFDPHKREYQPDIIMKTLHFLISAVLMAAATLGAAAQTAVPDTLRLSRQQCVAVALQDNPTIKVANLEVKRMDYSKKETLASLFPSIDFSGAYQRAIELQTVSMNMGGQSQQFKMGTDNVWNFGFSAAMPLVNASLWKAIKISDTQILSTLESARASRLDLVNNVNKAYYALLLAEASRDVIRQNYDLALFNASLFEKQFQAGVASEYDVLRSSVAVKNVEPELLQADIAVRQCSLQLKVLMGIDSAVEITPDCTLADMKQEMYGYQLQRDSALNRNTTLRSLDIQTRMARQNVDLKKFAWIPTLGVSYNINWNAMSNGNALKNQKFNPYSTVALALSVPIFSGGSKYSALKQAEIQVKELELQRENVENSLNMQVDLALDNINREIRQISSSEEGMKQAAKAREIMQKSFEIGAGSYLQVRDSELADTSAQLAYLQAIYNYLVSTSELDTLLGKEEALGITQTTF